MRMRMGREMMGLLWVVWMMIVICLVLRRMTRGKGKAKVKESKEGKKAKLGKRERVHGFVLVVAVRIIKPIP
jgi:flagellar biogenesis protein FliO